MNKKKLEGNGTATIIRINIFLCCIMVVTFCVGIIFLTYNYTR